MSLKRLREGGHEVWLSSNGVIMSDGIRNNGIIPPCYISHLSSTRGQYKGMIWLNPLFHGPRVRDATASVPNNFVVDPRNWFRPKNEPHGFSETTQSGEEIPPNADETGYVFMVDTNEDTPGNGPAPGGVQTPGDGQSDGSRQLPTPAEVAS